MKKLLLSTLALGAMSSVALAEPVTLTTAQMDELTAGSHGSDNWAAQVAVVKVKQSNDCFFCTGVAANDDGGGDGIDQENEAEVEIEQEIEQE